MLEAVLHVTSPALHMRQLPCDVAAEPLVLLHGWGADSTIFAGFAEVMAQSRDVILVDLPGFGGSEPWLQMDLEALFETLSNHLPDRFSLLGWSLGGMIASAFCERFPERVTKLITLAANACFVADREWRTAMPAKTFRQFCGFFNATPEACLKQFVGLEAQGDNQQRQLTKALRRFSAAETNHNWNQSLALLGEIDNRRALAGLSMPGLHLFGENDALVPVAAAAEISALNVTQKVEILDGVCHALHLSVPVKIAEKVNRFLSEDTAKNECLNKKQVAESFSRAAESYDGAAAFQRKIADRMLARLSDKVPANISPAHVLDVGCGTGYLSAGVRNLLPHTRLTALDLAPGMLAYAQEHRPVADRWVCGDAESLPLPENSVDLVVSNLAYQWCEQPELWGAELHRVLKNGGVGVFSTFGPNTLTELHASWKEVDDFVHVNQFIAIEKLQEQLSAVGLHCELVVEKHQLHYSDLKSLMRELKAIGAHNINSGRNEGLTSRKRLRKLIDAYEKFRNSDGQLPASYEVVYGVVKRPT